MNAARRSVLLGQMLVRNMSKTGVTTEVVTPKFKIMKEHQKRFGIDDGVPVYLKGGASDKILLALTVGLLTVGMGMTLEMFYTLSQK